MGPSQNSGKNQTKQQPSHTIKNMVISKKRNEIVAFTNSARCRLAWADLHQP